MKILPDYEHMEYRDVYTCRMYPAPCTMAATAAWPVTGDAELWPFFIRCGLRFAVLGLGSECLGFVSTVASSVLG